MESFVSLNLLRVLALLVATFECIISLELLELRVPGHVPLGTRAQLTCRWQLGAHDVLYSVKWYKDGKEFFRHVPRDVEPRRKFLLPGVDVESYDASGGDLTLAPAVLGTGGRYRCEVSGERPLFLTVSEHADLMVVVLPEEGPVITGLLPRYRPGDLIQVNCSSGLSHPATRLSWYINGEPASADNVLPPLFKQDGELIRTNVMLDFVVKESDFTKNGLKVKCLSTIPPLYWRSIEESALKVNSIHDKLLQVSPSAGTIVRDFRVTRADRVLENRAISSSSRRNDFIMLIYMFSTFVVS